ncbi:MAG: long-chain-acyl-CoA synthetase [Deltaproteobacteria bacterium]|nr:long-chain-acyl-CoA synthetase [Deltaproteobacteria bacterium]
MKFFLKYLGLVLFKKHTIGRSIEAKAAAQGEAPFLKFEGEVISYSEFNRRANRRAHLFHSLGVRKGDVVAVMMENRPEILETVVGLAKLGAVAGLINTNLKAAQLTHCLNISQAEKLVLGRECLSAFKEVQSGLERIKVDQVYQDTRWREGGMDLTGAKDLNALVAHQPTGNPTAPPMNSKDVAILIYTSGTTGMPKAARINHYRWYTAGLVFGFYALQLSPKDTLFCPLPLYHSNGILIAMSSALINGAAFAITRTFSASRFWEEVTKSGATSFIYIGEVLRYLMHQPPGAFDKAHTVTRITGNGLRPDIWPGFVQRFGIRAIREFYSSTEGNTATVNLNEKVGSVGKMVLKLSDNTILVRYDLDKANYVQGPDGFYLGCQPGEVGELLARISPLTPFYGYTSTKDTESKIFRNVFKKGDSYFKTGDLMKKDAEGDYFFVDRMGDTYRWKGENVSTQEVQESLSKFPGTLLAAVYGVEIPGTEGRVGMAALMLEKGKSLDANALGGFVVQHLPSYARPAFVRLVEHIDMTGTFKLKKTDLQKQGYDPAQVKGSLYYLDAAAKQYKPLDAGIYQSIRSGSGVKF